MACEKIENRYSIAVMFSNPKKGMESWTEVIAQQERINISDTRS